MTDEQPDEYLCEKIRTALAHDERVNELDLHVTIAASRIFITGNVGTQARKDAISTIVRDLAPDLLVTNEVEVTHYREPDTREALG